MNGCVCGIDLGTSSAKLVSIHRDGLIEKVRADYQGQTCESWWQAVCDCLSRLDRTKITAIALSGQVGTYIVDNRQIISWSDPAGRDELAEIKQLYSSETFIKEIEMVQPPMVSYPIPRLLYIGRRFPDARLICQPKDDLCSRLTGNCVSDPFSWRGLAHTGSGDYSAFFLDAVGINRKQLPPLRNSLAPAGTLTKEAALATGLRPGIPVYTGCNDFFAGLLGMGIWQSGDVFDISGTSEHIGLLTRHLSSDSNLISGPFFNAYVHYGVTASSGVSLSYGLKNFNRTDSDLSLVLQRKPPIFLPYLQGERAPIWDTQARGLFFGIGADCSSADMSYAVLEGVVFSLCHIMESLPCLINGRIITAGGASGNSILNRLKAEIFGLPVCVSAEDDTSALGTAMLASVAEGWYASLPDAQQDIVKIREKIIPSGLHAEILQHRFGIYKSLFPALKDLFREFQGVKL